MSSESSNYVLHVQDAGTAVVNGVYRCVGEFEGGEHYQKQTEHGLQVHVRRFGGGEARDRSWVISIGDRFSKAGDIYHALDVPVTYSPPAEGWKVAEWDACKFFPLQEPPPKIQRVPALTSMLKISGAGTEAVNGIYTPIGEFRGGHLYEKASASGVAYRVRRFGAGPIGARWTISLASGHDKTGDIYHAFERDPAIKTPPIQGWGVAKFDRCPFLPLLDPPPQLELLDDEKRWPRDYASSPPISIPMRGVKKECCFTLDLLLTEVNVKEHTFTVAGTVNTFFVVPKEILTEWISAESLKDFIKTTVKGGCEVMQLESIALPFGDLKNFPLQELSLPFGESVISSQPTSRPIVEYYVNGVSPPGLMKVSWEFEATVSEHMELDRFPFDRQSLLLQVKHPEGWEWQQGADWAQIDGRKSDTCKLSMRRTVADEFKAYAPICFSIASGDRSFKAELRGSLTICLNVQPHLGYFMFKIGLPLFLSVLINMSIFLVPPSDLADRMAIIATILLAITAFQYTVSDMVPKLSKMTYMDKYVASAYAAVMATAFDASVVSVLPEDVQSSIEVVVGSLLLFCWCGLNAVFWFLPQLNRQAWAQVMKTNLHDAFSEGDMVTSVSESIDLEFGGDKGSIDL